MPICAFCDLSGQGNINFTNGRNGEPRFRPLPARRLDVAMTPAEAAWVVVDEVASQRLEIGN